MVKQLNINQKDFDIILNVLLENKSETSDSVNAVVEEIVSNIQKNGDKALLEYTGRFDNNDFSAEDLRVTKLEISNAYDDCPQEALDALELAATRIEDYHKRQIPQDELYTDDAGVTLGWKWTAIDSAGLYVPGGLAAYPSTVLMNAIPARIAGVRRLAMVVPAPEGVLSPLVLAAARIAGIDEIYKIGGAQAVAALAFGTKTIPAVDKIVGPGNAYVAAAKRQLFGRVGIDMIAGPSEILVISDANSNPAWIAADLLSQAEHDKAARSILISDSNEFAQEVIAEVERLLKNSEREEIARASWENNAIVIIVDDMAQAAEISNKIAPEHLELAVDYPEALAGNITNAGAIFLGRYTPEAIGDYTAGPSHVLPTAGTARFSSGLSVFDFLKRSSIISCTEESMAEIGEETALLAEAEGLQFHALSTNLRSGKNT